MAIGDSYDPSDIPNGPGTDPPPSDGSLITGPAATNVSAIQGWYEQYLGRQASLAEVNSWLNNPGGLAAIEAGIRDSPEAMARRPKADPNDGGGDTGGTTGGTTGGGITPPPTFTPTPYTPPPALEKPPAFSYADFVAPDPNQLADDPVYSYTLKSEQDAIQKSAAARGILNTGGTINSLLTNASDIARQGYHDLWDRNRRAYDTDRASAFGEWKGNYGVDKDVYDTNYTTQYSDPFRNAYQGNTDAFNAGWYRTMFDSQRDDNSWDRKLRLLGLV